MEMPPESSTSDVLLDTYGEYHIAALGAEPRAADMAAEFAARQTTLRTALQAREAAERAETAAAALKARAEEEVEAVIRRAELSVLSSVEKQRDRDPYRRVFTRNLEGALKPIGAAQAAEGRRIANLLAPPEGEPIPGLPDDAPRHGADLNAACATLEMRVKAYDAAAAAVDAAFASELSERRRWREQYRKDHGLLTALFPDDARLVESFFRKPARKRKKPNEGND